MNYHHLYENPRAAASFLSRHAWRFPEAEGLIRKASEAYGEEVGVLASALDREDGAWREMNRVRSALVRRTPEARPWEGSRSVEPEAVWTAEVQRREHCILVRTLELEDAAIGMLRKAHAIISR